ncbi:uncharacterized protein [Sinocyclocheilus grahami]|uniref:uncharacterized protein n=1 Tax=Sinocyclocheilus grahami TaxID=75366 RepID=UPI0007AD4161|nr:PREDICTED: uncharacterized protein LOC107602581 [Sinocyclocheilus grahami]
MAKCVVQGCINHSDLRPGEQSSRTHKRFFRFPKDKARVKVWLAALRETRLEITDQHQICEDHFLSHHITPNGISPDAIPVMPPLEGLVAGWSSCGEQDEHSDPVEEGEVAAEEDLYDVEFEDYKEEDEDLSLADNGPYSMNSKFQGQCYSKSLINNPNINNHVNQATGASSRQVGANSPVESIQIHLKGCRGPIHILTCETEGPSEAVDPTNTESKLVKPACFLTLEESQIHTQPLISDVSNTVAAVQTT